MAVVGTVEKQPPETFMVGVRFNKLGTGESIQTPITTSKNLGTGADSTASFLQGAPVVSAGTVTQRILAGADGDRHRVKFQIVTNAGNTFQDEIDVVVRTY